MVDEAFLVEWVERLRAEIPGVLAVILKGSHVRGNAGPYSDVDFDVVVDDTEIDDPYPVWIVEHGGRQVHVSVAVERLGEWVRGFREVATWSFGFPSREVTRLMWVARQSLAAELDRPWREHPAAEPEIEDFIEELGKARNASLRGDEVPLRLAVQELAELAPRLLAPLNDPSYPGTRPEALSMALEFAVAPEGYREDMLGCLGLSGRAMTTEEALAAGERLVMGTLALVEANVEVFEPLVAPRLLGLVRDGTMLRYLGQELAETRRWTAMEGGEIVEFEPGMAAEVRLLILATLGSIDFSELPRIAAVWDSPELHADLDQIAEFYSGRGRLWVYREGDTIVGTVAILEIDRERAQLCRMFVRPEYQGRGVGQALLDHALGFARAQGYGEVILESWRVLTGAHRLYERNGFVRFREDEEQFDYRLELGQA